MAKVSKPIAETLKTAIQDSGMTVYQISQKSGVAQIVISRFVKGQRDLTLSTADKIAPVVGVQVKVKK